MARLGLERDIVDAETRAHSVARLREGRVRLPTWAELADPERIPAEIEAALASVGPDEAHPLNLFRVHWHNGADRRTRVAVPDHVVLPEALTGVPSPILVLLGDRFPMVGAHKVLAAYGCLVPRLVTGQFDATRHRAVWPSTGNYCRGGVAISRLLDCRGVAVLPEGMSEERFRWLEAWVQDRADIVRTVGTESNVKEIYDKCAALDADPDNVIFNQFCEFGNHLIHYLCTGQAAMRVYEAEAASRPGLRLAAFVSATGSAGTLGAGDRLKDAYGTKIVAAEALQCPTMLYNGYGEHNIQGIGDKHIPLIHNAMNTDVAVAISDVSTDSLYVLFHTEVGHQVLGARGLTGPEIAALSNLGFSGICNVLAAARTAAKLGLGKDDAVVTVATDGAAMYGSEIPKILRKRFPGGFDADTAHRVLETHTRLDTEDTLVLGPRDRERIFNLGYFTWVEQQGVGLPAFEARRSQAFWVEQRELISVWDALIEQFNAETAVPIA